MIVKCIVLVNVVKKQCVCDDGEMRCACEGKVKCAVVGELVKHVPFGSWASCVCGNGQMCCDCIGGQKCVCSLCSRKKSSVSSRNLVSPRMCASSGDYCNVLCCKESNSC